MHPFAGHLERTRVAWVALLLLGMVLGAVALRVADGGTGRDENAAQLAEGKPTASATTSPTATPTTPVPTTPVPTTPVPLPATTFRISSLNVLGAGHTAPGGNRHGWATGAKRMKWLVGLLRQHDVDVVGLQEFQPPQYQVFKALTSSEYAMYPGNAEGRGYLRNSIAWRTDTWQFVSSSWIKVPYFKGTLLRMPVVLLSNIETGQQAYFMNFQNPADAHGPAQRWRTRAMTLEIGLINRLRTQTGLPVFFTGDMNEKEEVFCRVTGSSDMISASGGTNDAAGCNPSKPLWVDWIFGSVETTFSDYIADKSKVVRRSTDHPMIVATAQLPPPIIAPPVCVPPTDPATTS